MSKYEPLRDFLEKAEPDTLEMNFADVEDVLGFRLPQSARRHQAWWANEAHGSHSHARSWQDAGWETRKVSLPSATVRFQRKSSKGSNGKPSSTLRPSADLWRRAHEITGISDREALLATALQTLIHREAGKRLAEMGGTIPDIEAPPRRRIDW